MADADRTPETDETPPAAEPTPAPRPAPAAAPAPAPRAAAADPNEGFRRLVEKHEGDLTAVARFLYDDNFKIRETARDLKSELKSKLPPDGSVVLTGDDAAAWAAYRALGEPDAITTALADRTRLESEVAAAHKADIVREAAALTGYDATVLATLARDVEITIVEEKGKDGKAVKVPRVKGAGDETTPLALHAEAHWAKFLPALKADASPPSRPGGTPPSRPGAPRPPARPEADKPRRSLVF